MKSQALQELVKRIFSDEQTRLQFESDPDSVLARYSLTEEEKRAVRNTHLKLGLVTSDSHTAVVEDSSPWYTPSP